MGPADPKLEELASLISGIRDRVRERYPQPGEGQVSVPDLLPILHARDAAYAKVASIGSVNPRRGGPFNALLQGIKKLIARALDWHVRDQVEFNRGVMSAIEAVLAALNENNRTLRELAARIDRLHPLTAEVQDIRSHWLAFRAEWERKLAVNETQLLRGLADLQTAYNHRATLMEGSFRDLLRAQHTEFTATLDRVTLDVQKRLWADLERVRLEYESLIHSELRLVRQRAALLQPASPPDVPPSGSPSLPRIDSMKFAEKFRGPVESIRERQRAYLDDFRGCQEVLDLGCGRGEFLSVLKEAGIRARGIDLSEECVATCRNQGLDAERADLFDYLGGLADQSIDGAFCAQVAEHLTPEQVPELIRLVHAKLRRNGVLAIETPNPECLAIFATHFYLDPTHTRPIPPALLSFYVEEQGFGRIEIRRLSPASESMPEVNDLPDSFERRFFGALDYAVVACRL